MSPAATANGYAIGAALLALWLFVRFPAFGPRTFRGGLLLMGAACVGLLLTGTLTGVAIHAAGTVFGLVAVYLPLLTYAFWAGLRMLQLTLAHSDHFRA
jgi:hypothetical protein